MDTGMYERHGLRAHTHAVCAWPARARAWVVVCSACNGVGRWYTHRRRGIPGRMDWGGSDDFPTYNFHSVFPLIPFTLFKTVAEGQYL